MILPDSGVLKIARLKTILGVWWFAIALARLKRQGLTWENLKHHLNLQKILKFSVDIMEKNVIADVRIYSV